MLQRNQILIGIVPNLSQIPSQTPEAFSNLVPKAELFPNAGVANARPKLCPKTPYFSTRSFGIAFLLVCNIKSASVVSMRAFAPWA